MVTGAIMGRRNRDQKIVSDLEDHIRKILADPDIKISERLQAVNAWVKLVELKAKLDDDGGNYFGKGSSLK